MSNGGGMRETTGWLPFADHGGDVDTNPSKSIAGRLAKSSPCQRALMNPRKPVILCVDDEPVNCELLANVLVANGYEVIYLKRKRRPAKDKNGK